MFQNSEFNLFFTSQRLPALPEKVFTRLDKLTRQHRVQEWVSGSGCGVGVAQECVGEKVWCALEIFSSLLCISNLPLGVLHLGLDRNFVYYELCPL